MANNASTGAGSGAAAGAGTEPSSGVEFFPLAPGVHERLRSVSGLRLFLLGFVTLFLELVFIRYLAASIWNLGYFPNIVLLTAFIGMGLGFVFHHRVGEALSRRLFYAVMGLIVLLLLLVYRLHPIVPGFSVWNYNVDGDLYFSFTKEIKVEDFNYFFFVFCFVLVALIFALLSQRTAKLFARFAPLDAYTLDILGSCLGILVFMGASALHTPAWSWMLLLALVLPFTLPASRQARLLTALLGCVAVFLMYQGDSTLLRDRSFQGRHEVTWSPYQKIEYVEEPARGNVPARLRVFANGLDHQEMVMGLQKIFYQQPYDYRAKTQALPPYENVLVIGAGSGNDVAAALLNGARHVDAVEIDPAIAAIGRAHNPYGAYADPRVSVHVDDGRAFMTNTTQKYDLIIFALTDSLVKVSSLSQLRLENYLFTRESIARAYALLQPRGNIVFYNYYRLPFVVDKINEILGEATGHDPQVLLRGADFVMLLGEKGPATAAPDFVPNNDVAVPTDDWPFLYLKARGIPGMYQGVMASLVTVIALLLAGLHWRTRALESQPQKGALAVKLAFVCMGVAFMLLETKGVIQFSLLFGTTWQNNSFIFLAVLVSVLAANVSVQALGARSQKLQWTFYILLLASVLATLVYPLGHLLAVESTTLRFLAASAFVFLPIYFANLIFSSQFQKLRVAEHVYGWNLLGATFGGVVEYSSMALGYAALSVVVALLYSAVFLLLLYAQRRSSDAVAASAAALS